MMDLINRTAACILAIAVGSTQVEAAESSAMPSEITAIDILLEPDAKMLARSADNNARLLRVFPKGFALDAAHTPHITMIQRFVRTSDLEKIYAVTGAILARANVTGMKLGNLCTGDRRCSG